MNGRKRALTIVQAIIFFLAQLIRCYIVCPAIKMEKLYYVRFCLLKICTVVIPPSIIVYLYKVFLDLHHEWLQLIAVCGISIITTGLSVLFIGIDERTRKMIICKLFNLTKRLPYEK